MNVTPKEDLRTIYVTPETRNQVVCEQLTQNYRLIKEEIITAKKIVLVFEKIKFQPVRHDEHMRTRFKEVAKEFE